MGWSSNGLRVPVRNESWNAVIVPNGGTLSGVGFLATWNNVTNARPTRFTLNTTSAPPASADNCRSRGFSRGRLPRVEFISTVSTH